MTFKNPRVHQHCQIKRLEILKKKKLIMHTMKIMMMKETMAMKWRKGRVRTTTKFIKMTSKIYLRKFSRSKQNKIRTEKTILHLMKLTRLGTQTRLKKKVKRKIKEVTREMPLTVMTIQGNLWPVTINLANRILSQVMSTPNNPALTVPGSMTPKRTPRSK